MDSVTDFDRIDFSSLSKEEADSMCKRLNLQLTHQELRHIQDTILKRPPTLAECLLWSIEGSEHCSYKSSKQHLKKLPVQAPNLLLGVGEDAGIVRIAKDNAGEEYGIAISHESHNHPSQIVPFEGAATGVGGNVRDISCMGATVIAVADSLRFGLAHALHTQWLQNGVVSGIASYGNALGIPNIAGDCYYHQGYESNCLVTVVSLGVVKKSGIIHSHTPKDSAGYQLILVGKPTDNSGFGGASFASADLNTEKANRGAVQEPNAFLERHLLKANEALFEKLIEHDLIDKVGFKDLGAGGIACASVELAAGSELGATVWLDRVHCSMEGLAPSVILCAETQERFMWSVPKELSEMILEHYNQCFDLPNVSNGAMANIIGEISSRPQFSVLFEGKTIVDAPAEAVVSGLEINRPAHAREEKPQRSEQVEHTTLANQVATILEADNLKSHQAIYEHYDKQVQGRTVIERGEAAAGVLTPFNSDDYPLEIQEVGVALSVSQNPFICQQSPELGAMVAVIQALEKVASVGASPQAITDCLCFGSPENPHHMNDFVKAVDGIAKACHAYELIEHPGHHLPVAAGNVSFYNQTKGSAIPASPMISCLGRMDKATKAITPSFKGTQNLLYTFRGDYKSFAGSQFAEQLQSKQHFLPPSINLEAFKNRIHFLHQAIEQELLLSAAPIHDGGLIKALTTMAQTTTFGAELSPQPTLEQDAFLFMETLGFVVEVSQRKQQDLLLLAETFKQEGTFIGHTTSSPVLRFTQGPTLSTLLKDIA